MVQKRPFELFNAHFVLICATKNNFVLYAVQKKRVTQFKLGSQEKKEKKKKRKFEDLNNTDFVLICAIK